MATLARPSTPLVTDRLNERGHHPAPFGAAAPGVEVLHFLVLAAAGGCLPGDVDLPQQYLEVLLQAAVPQTQRGP